VLLIAIIFGIVQMFSTKREPPRLEQPISVPVAKGPRPLASEMSPPADSARASKSELAKESRPDPNAKKPSMPRARVLFAAARNLDKAGKTEGAIVFYRNPTRRLSG
jgi:hypothetical protein